MRQDRRGWGPAFPAAAEWIWPLPSAAIFERCPDFPLSSLREAMWQLSLSLHCYKCITTHRATTGKVRCRLTQNSCKSESGYLYAQEFFGVLPELADEQSQISGQAGQAVVKLGIGKEFAD